MIANEPKVRYAGATFRSERDARWAVFFSELRMPWYYEVRAVEDLDFQPDFWLPKLRAMVRVEPPENISARGSVIGGCSDLAMNDRTRVILLVGSPVTHRGIHIDRDGGADEPYWWCVCPFLNCQKVGFEYQGRGFRVCQHEPGYDDRTSTMHDSALVRAYVKSQAEVFG